MNQPLAESNILQQQQDVVLYQSEDGEVKFHVNVFNENVWLNQADMVIGFELEQQHIDEI